MGQNEIKYDPRPKAKTRGRPTITYHEISAAKNRHLDPYDIRTEIRNSLGAKMDESSDLLIDFRYKDNTKMGNQLTEYTLPKLQEVNLVCPQKEPKIANRFMQEAFPVEVDMFILDAFEENENAKINQFLESLIRVANNVTKSVWIGRFTLSAKKLIKIFEAFRH
mmetsp:Transcript_18518/g.20664  ORF Transcript_18518/g.20664 Transcript_18518/m.20664 type:complete len:165 (+) Transcript_18518:22-516(+)